MSTRSGRRDITKVILNQDGTVRTRVKEVRVVRVSTVAGKSIPWFETGAKARVNLTLDNWGHPYYEVTETAADGLVEIRQSRASEHTGLTRIEMHELSALYDGYYAAEQRNIRDLRRMYFLEQKGTDKQVARLLKKHGLALEDEFN